MFANVLKEIIVIALSNRFVQPFNKQLSYAIRIPIFQITDEFNTLTANYEITRRSSSFPGCQNTGYPVLTHIKKQLVVFWQVF